MHSIFILLGVTLAACSCGAPLDEPAAPPTGGAERGVDAYAAKRERMVAFQIEDRGIRDPRVLAAMRKVPRHLCMPEIMRPRAYTDTALPIGHEQTISQPFIVAFMTAALELDGSEKVLEIGTGSGYQAAVLAEIVADVYSIEIVEPLGKSAAQLLQRLGYDNVHTRIGDGYRGWPEEAPFDRVILTAAPGHLPQPLIDQLAVGGTLIAPVGEAYQELVLVRKTAEGVTQQSLLHVSFVPMTGEAQEGAPR